MVPQPDNHAAGTIDKLVENSWESLATITFIFDPYLSAERSRAIQRLAILEILHRPL